MKTRNGIIGIIIIGSLLGCYQPPNLFETGRYSLAVDKIGDCTLEAVSYEQEGQLYIKGKMTFYHHREWPLSGDVLAQIYGPQGNLLQTKKVAFKPLPHARHLHPAARFQFVFDQMPPPGSLVKLTHTLRPFDGNVDDPIIR